MDGWLDGWVDGWEPDAGLFERMKEREKQAAPYDEAWLANCDDGIPLSQWQW